MIGPALLAFALSLASPPLFLSESLQVATEEPALGEEIARAARRYLRGPIQVRGLLPAQPGASPTPMSEHEVSLTVRKEPAERAGQRWLLVLSSGPTRQVRRTLELRESPTRFDLAEAVAIGLPDMLAELAEQSVTTRPRPSPPQVGAERTAFAAVSRPPQLPRTPRFVPEPTRAVPDTPRAAPEPSRTAPEPSRTAPETDPPRSQPPTASATSPVPPVQASPPVPPPAPEARREPPPVPPVLPPPIPPPLPRLLDPPPLREPRPGPGPAVGVGLLAGGAAVLLGGIGTGTAALVAAQQVNVPVQLRFDRELDERGKALGTAAIVLDCVGAAAIAGGGTWLLVRAVRARRSAPVAVSVVPAGAGGRVMVGGSF